MVGIAMNAASVRRNLFLIGMLSYLGSFFLFAFGGGGGRPVRGYYAAILAVLMLSHQNPFSPTSIFQGNISEYVALLLSCWINPLFLITIAVILIERHQRVVAILRIILLVMIPFCWVVFYYERFYPREGHFVWIFGMALALLSPGFKTRDEGGGA